MTEINYSTLWQPENKAALKELLIAEVNGMCRPDAPDIDTLRALIPDAVDSVIKNGVPETFIAELVFGDTQLKGALCRGCDGQCCRHCDPIGLTVQDAQQLAKTLGIAFKDFITAYLMRNPARKVATPYAFKQTRPCVFLDEDGKCKVYDVRPSVCQEYPLTNFDGELGVTLADYCKLAVNAAAFQSAILVDEKFFGERNPGMMEAMRTMAASYFPSESELDAMSQPQRLMAIAAGDKKFAELAFGKGIKDTRFGKKKKERKT